MLKWTLRSAHSQNVQGQVQQKGICMHVLVIRTALSRGRSFINLPRRQDFRIIPIVCLAAKSAEAQLDFRFNQHLSQQRHQEASEATCCPDTSGLTIRCRLLAGLCVGVCSSTRGSARQLAASQLVLLRRPQRRLQLHQLGRMHCQESFR